jgi:hypothetical protein
MSSTISYSQIVLRAHVRALTDIIAIDKIVYEADIVNCTIFTADTQFSTDDRQHAFAADGTVSPRLDDDNDFFDDLFQDKLFTTTTPRPQPIVPVIVTHGNQSRSTPAIERDSTTDQAALIEKNLRAAFASVVGSQYLDFYLKNIT